MNEILKLVNAKAQEMAQEIIAKNNSSMASKNLLKAMEKLKIAFDDVVTELCEQENISEHFDEKYPFDICFHDLTYDVNDWVENFRSKI